ncbi:uncharacterized protein G2W53_029002 [Senna tora]|uniref:Uncharacterized protein n=1 Tax=Senna tora TaxID=362788 RepID=A0A834T227_9FABA|nr:uncharacterized protein G2W53_029002 [Senna tora]
MELLVPNLIKCIGNGESASQACSHFPLTMNIEVIEAFPLTCVNELINEETGEWQGGLIQLIFGGDICEYIVQMTRNIMVEED